MNFLSQRAKLYLKKLERNHKYFFDRDDTVECFLSQVMELPSVFLDAQLAYSGYRFTVEGDRGSEFSFYLLSSITKPIEFEEEGGRCLLYISEAHRTAQFAFYLADNGEIVTWGRETQGELVPIYSSIEMLLENYAYKDEIARKGFFSESYYVVKDKDRLLNFLSKNYEKEKDCSDKYCHWYVVVNMIVAVVPAYDERGGLLTIYKKKSSKEEDILSVLKLYL